MKRTLFVMFDFPPSIGGAQIYDWDMVRALPKEKVVIIAGRTGDWKEFDRESDYTTYRLPQRMMEKLSVPILVPVVAFLAIYEKVEQIWFSKYSRLIYFTTLFTSRVLGLPYGMTVFGEDLAWAVQDFGIRWPRGAMLFRDLAVRRASTIIANSKFSASFLPRDVKHSVIYPCEPLRCLSLRYGGVPTRECRDDTSCVRFLSLGTLSRKKGFDLVIRALALGLPGVSSFCYVIAGVGPEERPLRRLAKDLNIEGVVRFAGSVSESQRDQLYREADVFVMPSRIEGFGIVFLEAAMYGVCSIGSRAGGIPEVIKDGETGILVETENIFELREALARLGRNRLLRSEMGNAARLRCEMNFSWERLAAEWRAVFNSAD